MKQIQYVMLLILFLSVSLAGCIGDTQNKSKISLDINLDSNNGTIIESYSDGDLISTTNVFIQFNFSQTKSSSKITTFGIDTMDGKSPITVDASSNSIINVEFSEHGIYNVSAYAINVDKIKQSIPITIKIDLRIEWIETKTDNPKTLTFDPNPVNGGPNPLMIEFISVVENPSLIEDFEGGQSVQITWNIVDEQNDICQKKTTEIADGESDEWHTIHFNTFMIHDLIINYDDGQDYVNINQTISILYDEND